VSAQGAKDGSAVLRVGLAGAGNIAVQHARGWSTYPARAKIAAIADVDPNRTKLLNDDFAAGEAKTYESTEALIADPDLDVIDICLPHHLHVDAVIAAARAGKAVLCEKPLCTNLADARRIKETLCQTGTVFMSAHNQLFQPSLIEARRLMAGGVIGQPYLIRSIETFQSRAFNPWSADGSSGPKSWGWRSDLAQSGGGELLDPGYHGTYRLLSLAGERPVEVTGLMSRFFQQELKTEDTGMVLVRFASGVVGEILTSWALDVVGGRHFEISGELGALAGSATSLQHQLYTWPEPSTKTFQPVASFTAEIGHFLDVVQRGAPNPAPIDLAARTLQVIKAAYVSANLGQTVTLPEDPTAAPEPRQQPAATAFSVTVPEEVLA
jgi:predicted dehydrogenase